SVGSQVESAVPVGGPVVIVFGIQDQRIAQAAGIFCLLSREGLECLNIVVFKEFERNRSPHVGNLGLQTLFANFREATGFIDHATHLSAHSNRASLAGVTRAHFAPEPNRSDLHRLVKCIEDSRPTTASSGSATAYHRDPP